MMVFWIPFGILGFQILLGGLVGYLVIITIAAAKSKRSTEIPASNPSTKFLILIPAHNEERLLPELLTSLGSLSYPRNLVSVYVIADNCTDETAKVAADQGANVLIRTHESLRGKGYALQWGFQKVRETGYQPDAVVIFDADTLVSPNFLQVMDARLRRGERIIQSFYAVQNPGGSPAEGLRYAAFAVLHYLRPLGRMALGFSAGLKGNGMVFAADILERYQWSGSVTEDIDLHMALLLQGERVTFAPDAVVWGEMPNQLSASQTQHTRWEQGRLQMARQYVPALISAAGKEMLRGRLQRSCLLLDAMMEHLIPPFAMLFFLTMLAFLLSLGFVIGGGVAGVFTQSSQFSPLARLYVVNLLGGIFLFAGQGIYLAAGLWAAKAPGSVYRSLLFVPVYLVWKVRQYLVALTVRDQQGWIRTVRNK